MQAGSRVVTEADLYRQYIREIPDFPKPGVSFKDLTPLLGDGKVFAKAIDDVALICRQSDLRPQRIACPEARGFIYGAALAYRLGLGLALIRKPGKLPWKTTQVEYSLEYGKDRVEMHVDAVLPGERVLIVDDVLATGGTTRASADLIAKSGGLVAGCVFIVELLFLRGRERLQGLPVFSLVQYE